MAGIASVSEPSTDSRGLVGLEWVEYLRPALNPTAAIAGLQKMNRPIALLAALALSTLAGSTRGEEEKVRVAPSAQEIENAVENGVKILLDMQESLSGKKAPSAEWPYQGVYRVGGKIPVGYRVGGTSIAAWSLLDAPGWKDSSSRRKAVERALDFVLETLEHPLMASGFKGRYDVRGWGHTYALTFLLRLRELERVPRPKKKLVDEKISWLVQTLQENEIPRKGGWNYARRFWWRGWPWAWQRGGQPSTFMTASTLQALFAAAAQGEEVDAEVVERALEALESARVEAGAYQYALSKKDSRASVPGAIARMAICETTLMQAGRGDVGRLQVAIEAFFEHWQFLEDRRRQSGTHVPPHGVAPYYFYYGHMYAAQAIELLPREDRERQRKRLHTILFGIREEGGGWNDRVFPRSENFGTAMVLLALSRPASKAPHDWQPAK